MRNYAYVMSVRGRLDDYQITGDAYSIAFPDQIVHLALNDVAGEKGEALADLEVLAFSCMEDPSCG